MSSPFDGSQTLVPGHGLIHLALLPPNLPRLRTVEYQYPLKLVSPAPIVLPAPVRSLVHTVYLLTYGGGLVAGDQINLKVEVEGGTRLTLLTQGSTKLFKSPDRKIISKQRMTVNLRPGAALCYLPDPVQPFEHSCFEQHQIYNIDTSTTTAVDQSSFCVLDWVSNGRSANGEDWSFYHYSSRNEVYRSKTSSDRTLLLRDNIILDGHETHGLLTARMQRMAVLGTLIIHGTMFKRLMQFFLDEFKLHPRIGGRKWDAADDNEPPKDTRESWRAARQQREKDVGLLWSVAATRGCVVVKFAALELEHGRHWLRDMLETEGTVVSNFGERALLCL